MSARLPFRSAVLCAALAAIAATIAIAQPTGALAPEPPPIPTPDEYSDVANRTYTQRLREARALVAERRLVEALPRLDALIAERPREPQARFLRAVVLADLDRRDDSIAALREMVADFPELPEPHNNLGVLYAARGEYELARAELALALATQPDYAIAHENMGDLLARLAATHYERAIALDRTNKSAPAKLRTAREIFATAAPVNR